jgi:hypothetical protein
VAERQDVQPSERLRCLRRDINGHQLGLVQRHAEAGSLLSGERRPLTHAWPSRPSGLLLRRSPARQSEAALTSPFTLGTARRYSNAAPGPTLDSLDALTVALVADLS